MHKKERANYVPLSPVSFLGRAAQVYPNRAGVIYGERHLSHGPAIGGRAGRTRRRQGRCRGRGHAERSALPEAHFAVPMLGAVVGPINTQLDAAAIAFILHHGEAKVPLPDTELEHDRLRSNRG